MSDEKRQWWASIQRRPGKPPNTRDAFKVVRDAWLSKRPNDLWCGICDRYIDRRLVEPHPMALTVDHIRPLSRGGTNDEGNLQPAHAVCNFEKGAKLMKELRHDREVDRIRQRVERDRDSRRKFESTRRRLERKYGREP